MTPQQQPQYGQAIANGVPPNGIPAIILNQQTTNLIVDQKMLRTNPLTIRCMFCEIPITTNLTKKCNCLACSSYFATGIIFYVCLQALQKKDFCY